MSEKVINVGSFCVKRERDKDRIKERKRGRKRDFEALEFSKGFRDLGIKGFVSAVKGLKK